MYIYVFKNDNLINSEQTKHSDVDDRGAAGGRGPVPRLAAQTAGG